jgi:hypothetical protein
MKKLTLTTEESNSIKKSLQNIYALLLSQNSVKPQYITCLIKWGIQLKLNYEEVSSIIDNVDKDSFVIPEDKLVVIQSIYDLVHLIYLDDKVEDLELEVATVYTQALGYKPHLVGDILKTILAAPYDGLQDESIREEIKNLAEMNYNN